MNLGGEIENGAVVLGGRGKGGMTRIRFLDDYLATKSRIAYIGINEAIAKYGDAIGRLEQLMLR